MVGSPYQAVLRLYAIAGERWPELDASYPAVDLLKLPIHQFLNYVYAWCVERLDPEKREEWEMGLADPLPGREPSPAQIEREGEDFMNFMSTMGGIG